MYTQQLKAFKKPMVHTSKLATCAINNFHTFPQFKIKSLPKKKIPKSKT